MDVSTGQLRKERGFQLCTLKPEVRADDVAGLKLIFGLAAELGASVINLGTLRDQGLLCRRRRASAALRYDGFVPVECTQTSDETIAVQAAAKAKHMIPFLEERDLC